MVKAKQNKSTVKKWKCPKCGTIYKSNPKFRKKACEECGPVDNPIWITESE